MLGVGILYVVQYQDRLIEAELEAMRAEAQLFAGAIAEGATQMRLGPSASPYQSLAGEKIIPNLAGRMVKRFSESKQSMNVRLYNTRGELIADSSSLIGPSGAIAITQSRPKKQDENLYAVFDRFAEALLSFVPQRLSLRQHPDMNSFDALSFPDALSALDGVPSSTAWAHPRRDLVFMSAAAPVQRVRQVLGVVYLTKPATDIERQVREMQVEILKIFLIVFAITVVFSFYLSNTMAGPLKRLARAAEKIRISKSRDIELPDMDKRRDEIGELARALRDMTQALWLRMDGIEAFAADVSHELKNPLTSLRSAVETLSKVEDPKKRDTLLRIINHDIQRLDRLITDISRASRLDAELSKEELQPLDIGALLDRITYRHTLTDQALQNINNNTKACNFAFRTQRVKGVFIMGNETRLTQVIDNLIANAVSFSPEKGTISLTAVSAKSKIRIRIDDEGPGIPESKYQKIFDRFYTQRPEREDYGNHSGLGLSIAKQIIEVHGGTITAQNRYGVKGEIKGARFTVELPRIEDKL